MTIDREGNIFDVRAVIRDSDSMNFDRNCLLRDLSSYAYELSREAGVSSIESHEFYLLRHIMQS